METGETGSPFDQLCFTSFSRFGNPLVSLLVVRLIIRGVGVRPPTLNLLKILGSEKPYVPVSAQIELSIGSDIVLR